MIKHNYTLVVSNREPGTISEFNSQNFGKKEVGKIMKKFSHNIPKEEVKEDIDIDNIRDEIGYNPEQLELLPDSSRMAHNLIIK